MVSAFFRACSGSPSAHIFVCRGELGQLGLKEVRGWGHGLFSFWLVREVGKLLVHSLGLAVWLGLKEVRGGGHGLF